MRASHTGPFAVLPQVLALCALLAGSELALAQTAAHNPNASVTAGVKVGGPTSNAAASHCAGQSRKVGGNTASCPAVVAALDPANKQTLKGPDATAGFSLASSYRCTAEKSEFTVGDFDPAGFGTIRPCYSHSYAPQDARAPLVPSSIADDYRSGVVLPGANNVHDNNIIDHFRLVDDDPADGPKHWSLLWVERPDPRRNVGQALDKSSVALPP